MTMYEYRLCIQRYLHASSKAMEHTRFISYTIYCTMAKDKLTIQQYMPLPTDKKQPENEVSKERLLEMQELAKTRYEIMQKLNKK